MKKADKPGTSSDMQEGQVIDLNPDDVIAHPTIAYLEEHGIFPIGAADIDNMAQSVSSTGGFLQPIVITPNSEGGFFRVIGRRRTETAKKLGISIPCYIRFFSSDQDIINAWKSENFIRAQYTSLQQIKEAEKIEQIWSKRTAFRVKASQKCVPELQLLIEKGIFQMRSDQDIISACAALPVEIQQAIATGVENSKVTITENKEVIREIVKDPELKTQIQERDDNIATLEDELAVLRQKLIDSERRSTELMDSQELLKDALAKKGDDNEEVKRLQEVHSHNENVLKNTIKAKEKEIAELGKKNNAMLQDMASKIHDTLIKQTNHVHRLTQRLINETKTTMSLLKEEVSALKCEAEVKEHLLVIKDGLEKARGALLKDIEATDKIISDKLVDIESLQTSVN